MARTAKLTDTKGEQILVLGGHIGEPSVPIPRLAFQWPKSHPLANHKSNDI